MCFFAELISARGWCLVSFTENSAACVDMDRNDVGAREWSLFSGHDSVKTQDRCALNGRLESGLEVGSKPTATSFHANRQLHQVLVGGGVSDLPPKCH